MRLAITKPPYIWFTSICYEKDKKIVANSNSNTSLYFLAFLLLVLKGTLNGM